MIKKEHVDNISNFLSGFNLQTMIGLIVIGCYFSNGINSKLDRLECKLEMQAQRTDKLYEMFIELLKEKK